MRIGPLYASDMYRNGPGLGNYAAKDEQANNRRSSAKVVEQRLDRAIAGVSKSGSSIDRSDMIALLEQIKSDILGPR